MIATGVYLDDIEEAIAHLRQDTRQRYQTEVYRLFIFTAVFLVLTCLLAWYFHKNITATFQRYSRDISEKEQQLRQTNRALEEKVKQRTREVRKSERNFRSMIEKSPLPILVIDHTGKILLINEKFSQVFGYTREDLVTESDWWEALFPDPTYCQEIQATWYQNMRQSPEESGPESSTHTWNVVTKHQAGKTCEFHLVPMKDFSLVVMNDITAKLEAEQERQRLEKQLLQAQKMEAIGTLAGGIAHDFNNLLASIIGFTELVLEDLTEDNLTRDNLREVLKAGNRAKELVLQILTFARQTDDQVSQVELGPIIKETMKFLQATTPKP